MNNTQLIEQLGLTYKCVDGCANRAVMSAPVLFYLYNPAFFSSPELLPEYLLEAKAAQGGQYQLSMLLNDGPWVVEEYSKLVVLTEAEAAQFKELFNKSMELHARNQISGRVYDGLLNEFEALKASYDHRASLFDAERLTEVESF